MSCGESSARLYQLNDGRFQIVESGAITPFMHGFRYALVEAPLAEFIKSLGVERVTFEPAVIFDRGENKEYRSHFTMRVGQFFVPSEIRDLNLDVDRILTMGEEYIFISPSLKEKLGNRPFLCIEFSEGLNGFAGSDV